MRIASLSLALAFVAAGCAGDDPSMTKEEAAQLSGKADGVGDLCDAFGWYDDGVCDEFCPRPDPDCVETCFASQDCADGQYCSTEDGACDLPCPDGAESCPAVCAGVCLPEPEPEPSCTSSADCAEGEHCSTEDGDCDSPCPDDAEGCPTVCAGVCVPDEEPQACGGLPGPDQPSGVCSSGEYCYYEPGSCLVIADAPGTCEPRPEACIDIYAPVCGCDGVTYSNSCYAAAAGVSVAHVDVCQ